MAIHIVELESGQPTTDRNYLVLWTEFADPRNPGEFQILSEPVDFEDAQYIAAQYSGQTVGIN
ncbi:hypothetical protein HYW32_01660 [Candidatus Berkelbacteria bacterium]|nr:hypothetical protein [Candidatus Berkelbacteria bacterium]